MKLLKLVKEDTNNANKWLQEKGWKLQTQAYDEMQAAVWINPEFPERLFKSASKNLEESIYRSMAKVMYFHVAKAVRNYKFEQLA